MILFTERTGTPTIEKHFLLDSAHGRGNAHINMTPMVNAAVQQLTTTLRTTTHALWDRMQASRVRKVIIDALEMPMIRTYSMVAAYMPFCMSSMAVAVSRYVFLPSPDFTAHDTAMVLPIASTWFVRQSSAGDIHHSLRS